MITDELAQIKRRKQHATTLSNEAVIAGDNDWPFLRFCADNYLPDVIVLLRTVEQWREIVRAVATTEVLAHEGDAGDNIICPFCNGDEAWPHLSAQEHPIDRWFVHEPTCVVMKARTLLAGDEEVAS